MGVRLPVKIDYRKCIGCNKCYDHCPMDVFTRDEELNVPKVTYMSDCWFCGVCMMECPQRAIDIRYPLASW